MKRSAFFQINWMMLIRIAGWLLLVEGLFMAVPLLTSLYYGEEDFNAFLIAMGVTLGCGVVAAFCVRPRRFDMGKREGFLLTALVWVVFSFFGMIPFLLSTTRLTVSEAYFEAMSGFTTTGASVMPTVDDLSHGIHLWRALMQWIGGMGIILFTLAVLPMLNSSGGMQMFNAEVTGITHEKLRPRVSSTAKRLWLVYILLTALLMGLYWIGPMDSFDSVCHAFSTMSTGGFSTRPESIAQWNSLYIKIVTTVFMFIGGVNFALIFKASLGDLKGVWRNEVFRVYVGTILALLILFDISLVQNPLVPDKVESYTIDPLFMIISMMSSTGYTLNGVGNWGLFIFSLILIMMFVGACAGSTSGGSKLDRSIYLWKNARNELYRCIYPNHILSVNINGRTITPEITNKVMVFLSLYIVVILAGGIVLSINGIPLQDAFFSSFSCVSNTGLCNGFSGLGESYAVVPDAGKWVLSLLMLTGRLEIFTVLLLFTPGFWNR